MGDQGGFAHKTVKNVPGGHRLMDEGCVDNIFAYMKNNKGCMLPLDLLALLTIMSG
jgi:hypothetical protein